MAQARVHWAAIDRQTHAFVDALTDAALAGSCAWTGLDGHSDAAPLWKLLLHVANHGTHTRAQIAQRDKALKDLRRRLESAIAQRAHYPDATDPVLVRKLAGAKLRDQRIAMVLQDPKYSLDPVMSVGQQIAETHRTHLRSSARDARGAALEMLEAVHIRDPERVWVPPGRHVVRPSSLASAVRATGFIGGPNVNEPGFFEKPGSSRYVD